MLLALLLTSAALEPESAVRTALQREADRVSLKYGTAVTAAIHSQTLKVAVASGHTDAGLGMGVPTRLAKPNDEFVWGSVTKMFTAPAVLQLVEKGTVGLDDLAAGHVDPMLKPRGATFARQFGLRAASSIRIRHLLHMTSGLGDCAVPSLPTHLASNRYRAA